MLSYAERNSGCLTSSKLKAFAQNPYHAYLQYVLCAPSPIEEEPDYFIIGQAVDDYLTYGPDGFAKRYVVVARRTQESLAGNVGKTLLTPSQKEKIDSAVGEYRSRAKFFPQLPKKHVMEWQWHGLKCRSELDHYDMERQLIQDVKTTASITTFDPASYLLQMAFYAYGIEKTMEQKPAAELCVVDKHAGWARSHKWIFTNATLRQEFYRIEGLVQQWKDCQESGIWPHADVSTDEGRRACWNSPYYVSCPFCRSDSPSFT